MQTLVRHNSESRIDIGCPTRGNKSQNELSLLSINYMQVTAGLPRLIMSLKRLSVTRFSSKNFKRFSRNQDLPFDISFQSIAVFSKFRKVVTIELVSLRELPIKDRKRNIRLSCYRETNTLLLE